MSDRSMLTPENVRAFLGDSFPGHLGIEPLEIESSHARGKIVVDQRHLHPGGYVHGGAWTALGDTVAAWVDLPKHRARARFHDDRAEAERLRGGAPRRSSDRACNAASRWSQHGCDRGEDRAHSGWWRRDPACGQHDRHPVRALSPLRLVIGKVVSAKIGPVRVASCGWAGAAPARLRRQPAAG